MFMNLHKGKGQKREKSVYKRQKVNEDEVQENKEHNIMYVDMPDAWNRL